MQLFMYSVQSFNKLRVQSFLTPSNYSAENTPRAVTRQKAGDRWPGLFCKRARFLRDALPHCAGGDEPVGLSLTHGVSLLSDRAHG